MAPLARLASLDNEDVRTRVMQNFQRINASLARFERRLAEYRYDRRRQSCIGREDLLRSGAEGGRLVGEGRGRAENEPRQNE